MGEQALAIQETGPTAPAHIDPEAHIEYATRIANALSDVVEKQGLYTTIGKKKHVNAEGWETVISLDMAHPIIDSVAPILGKSGEIVAYVARAIVAKNGETISSGEMICGLDDEFVTKGKNGWAKHRAAMSAAQTWAVAKAGRTKYAWIVALAGYSGTPAEEMVGVQTDEREDDPQSPYFCPEHKVVFFKKGRMRNHAHPIEGSDDWHNMPVDGSEEPSPPSTVAEVQTPSPVATTSVLNQEDFVNMCRAVGWTTIDVAALLGMRISEWIPHPDGAGKRTWTAGWNECVERWKATDDVWVVEI